MKITKMGAAMYLDDHMPEILTNGSRLVDITEEEILDNMQRGNIQEVKNMMMFIKDPTTKVLTYVKLRTC
jgi:hypothetical protein